MAVSANDPDSPAQPANPATRPPNPDTASMRYAENSEGGREVGEEPLGAIDYWRSIILYGLNTATYKLALAEALFLAQSRGETTLSYGQLGRLFYELYRERVQAGRPQLVTPGRETVVERVLRGIASGKYAEDEAVAMLARDAFGDVVPRFHTVGKAPIPVRFFEATPSGLVLTDALFRLWSDAVQPDALRAETVARWDLLEGAFTVYRTRDTRLVNDVLRYYLLRGHQRTDLTPLRPVLHGYQGGLCFYCLEPLDPTTAHVDHLIPRQVLQHDEVWNLVLAHYLCNASKSNWLPGRGYLEKLWWRNEHLIASRHPLQRQVVAALGTTPAERRRRLLWHYENAEQVIGRTWSQAVGYDPAHDPLYKKLRRSVEELHT
jgi:5-methylcytosine-specific restriction endonuclease McrA